MDPDAIPPPAVQAAHTMPHAFARSAALLLGLGLGGFFDGILLHQILQWHHLLSDVRVAAVQDLRMQLLADGLFHLFMYVVVAIALALMWRARRALVASGAGTQFWGSVLVGFGTWHVVDALLSHWLTGIHRVRGDAANPLFWDLLWFCAFGVAPILLGLWLRRRKPPGTGDARRSAAGLAMVTLTAGVVAALPPPAANPSVVVFRPGVQAAAAFDALARADARVLWADQAGDVWIVRFADQRRATWPLVQAGAVLVGGSWAGWGCANWSG